MLLYGAGGHAKGIISSLLANGIHVDMVFDDAPEPSGTDFHIIRKQYNPFLFPQQQLIISIGDNKIRRNIAEMVSHPFGRTIHPSAIVESNISVGQGTVILHRCVVQSDVRIGKHVIINTGAIIEHDCIIEDFVHLAPCSALCGNVQVGEGTVIGAGTVVAPNIRIGRHCQVAAGSVVTKNIPDGALLRGNPARIFKILMMI
jgi:sugar O-acyltransferase (sialic acid O-acetyltransferase NeuD family)